MGYKYKISTWGKGGGGTHNIFGHNNFAKEKWKEKWLVWPIIYYVFSGNFHEELFAKMQIVDPKIIKLSSCQRISLSRSELRIINSNIFEQIRVISEACKISMKMDVSEVKIDWRNFAKSKNACFSQRPNNRLNFSKPFYQKSRYRKELQVAEFIGNFPKTKKKWSQVSKNCP